jgi:ABC-2 type transport system ATP-binding protein
MLQTKDIVKRYGKSFELDIPNLQIEKGEVFGLVGNNGAGKTTFLRLVLDLIKADEGALFSKDINVAGNEDWKAYTGSYLDPFFLINFLTPEEYFEFVASTYALDSLPDRLVQFESLFAGQVLNQGKKYIRELSAGNQQRVGIAAALLMGPKVLVLDEPFNSLDPTSQIQLKRLLLKTNKENDTTMLLSSHDLNHVSEICTRIAILEDGKIIKDIKTTKDTLSELEAYFKPK